MDITEARVKIVQDPSDKLLAYCTITIGDGFVIRDLKIIDGPKGPFIAMPSRKLTRRCSGCGNKNHLRAAFCSECGKKQGQARTRQEGGRVRLHADVAHPINSRTREKLHAAIMGAYERELERSRQPGYVPTRLGADYDDDDHLHHRGRQPVGHGASSRGGGG
jgi:stage V sporulation protein G